MSAKFELPAIPAKDWERGDFLDKISDYEATYIVTAEYNGHTYTGSGLYDCGELIEVEDIEITN